VSCDGEVLPWLKNDDGYAGVMFRVYAGWEGKGSGCCGLRLCLPASHENGLLHGCCT
jgi:hypothetical protein